VVELMMKIMMIVVIAMVMIKCSGLEKKEEKKGLKAKVISIGPFCFGDQDT
jgi:hypothetical protein